MEREAGHHLRADRVQRELERGHDAEVAAAAAQRPEQLGMLVRAPRARARRPRVTSSTASMLSTVEAVLALEPARAAASARPATPVLETRPPDGGEAVLLGRRVDLAQVRPAPTRATRRSGSIIELAQAADVDDEAVVDEREAGDRVAARAHRDAVGARSRERERGDDLWGWRRARRGAGASRPWR